MQGGIGFAHGPDAVRTRHARHHEIEESAGHLRAGGEQIERGVEAGDLLDAYAWKRIPQQEAEAFAEQGVVVSDQNLGGCCHGLDQSHIRYQA
jgi:hypothetical protein